jgi:hypothetical protein
MKPEELFAQALFIDSPWFVEKIGLDIQRTGLNILPALRAFFDEKMYMPV